MIRLESVTKHFQRSGRPAVAGLSLNVDEGTVMTLVGPSGCGKTTTLKMINRLVEPDGGRVLVAGRDVAQVRKHELRRGIGYVIQNVGLFPHKTVASNIGTVPRLLGWDRIRTAGRVEELMDLVGLDRELGRRYPSELSGGQQQRAGVARALAADPPVLLMDEPFGAVDPVARVRLQEELKSLQDRLRKTIVFVTHDVDEAISLGDRIAILNVGGVLEQTGTPDELLAHPANDFVKRFLGSERELKRLALRGIGEIELDPPGPAAGRVGAEGSLREALDAALGADDGRTAVVLDGSVLGTLTVDRIREVLL